LIQLDGLGIDFAGFVFADEAQSAGTKLNPAEIKKTDLDIKKVGVFRDPEMIEVLDAIDAYGLDAVELLGSETPEMCEDLGSEVEVIKSFHLDQPGINLDKLVEPYDAACDYYLFEGHGKSFDWPVLKKSRIEKPFFLGGGMGMEELPVIKALEHPDFFGIAINEGFDKPGGGKDMVKILQFKQGLKK
jgi:phosphoribosylanthranilate isomerase